MLKLFFSDNEFRRNLLVLLSGTTIAQILPIALSPVLTRAYAPEDFGLFGLYTAICTILSVFSSGRYDLSIIEIKEDFDAKQVVVASLILSAIFSLLILVVTIFFREEFAIWVGSPKISPYLFTVPITVFSLSCYSVFTYWLNRRKQYKAMSINRVIASSSTSSISLMLSNFQYHGGLVVGYIGGQALTVFFLWNKIFKETFPLFPGKAYGVMKKYSHYPKYLIPSTLAAEIAGQMPTILIASLFGTTVNGFFSFTTRVITLPLAFIGNSIGEVYRQKAAQDYNEFGNCKSLFVNTLFKLAIIGALPFSILFFSGEFLFEFVFGKGWDQAGIIAKYMSFSVFFQLISTPLSYTITFNRSQKYDLVLQILRAIFSIAAIYMGHRFSNYIISVILYSTVYSLYYICHTILQYRAACGNKHNE